LDRHNVGLTEGEEIVMTVFNINSDLGAQAACHGSSTTIDAVGSILASYVNTTIGTPRLPVSPPKVAPAAISRRFTA
jgi:hypothetical protein